MTKNLKIDQIKELDALVSLIDEPNEGMYTAIREKVISYGITAIPLLEEVWVNTFGEIDSDRIESLIEDIRREHLKSEISLWLDCEDPGLLEGYFYLMRYLKPGFEESSFRFLFEKMYREVWLELNENLTALERIKVFNHVIYHVNGISNTQKKPLKSDTYYLSYLDEKGVGNSMLIGSIYIAIAQKLSIPVYGIDLPENFVLVYMDDINKSKKLEEYTIDDVLFYINPGNKGAVFTHNEISHYLRYKELKDSSNYFLPISNKQVLTRVIEELAAVYEMENSIIKKNGLEGIILKLTHG